MGKSLTNIYVTEPGRRVFRRPVISAPFGVYVGEVWDRPTPIQPEEVFAAISAVNRRMRGPNLFIFEEVADAPQGADVHGRQALEAVR